MMLLQRRCDVAQHDHCKEVVLAETYEEYRSRWVDDLARAEASKLPSNQERFRRSAARWKELEERAVRIAEIRENSS